MQRHIQYTQVMRSFGALFLLVGLLTGQAGLARGAYSPPAPGGFRRDDGSVSNRQRDAGAPAIVLGSLAGDATKLVPWVGFEQRSSSSAQDILVKTFDAASNQWVLRGAAQNGGSLNFDRSVEAEHPSIDFAGPIVTGQRTVPWTAWYEPVKAFGDTKNIFASKFVKDATDGIWQVAGQDRGSGVPSINIHTDQEAENPALAGGSTQPGATATVPWVTWEEDSAANGKRQIFVSRAQPDATAIGGFRWVPTGQIRLGSDEPTINVDVNRDGVEPDMTFSGPGNTVPWAVWYEQGGNRAARVFAAKAVADASAGVLGGFRWDIQPDCAGDEINCALNRDPNAEAVDPKIASGALANEDPAKPKPWIVWQEDDGGHTQIFVSRFDGTRFVPVGASLNVSPQHNAENPDIVFVGRVPFVTFVEEFGSRKVLLVRHLANPATGRWDLDTHLPRGLNTGQANPPALPALGTNGNAPFVAWQEGDRARGDGIVFEAHRVPAGPAWGTAVPAFLSPTTLAQDVTITCNNVEGWANLKEIQFALNSAGANPQQTVLIKYTAPDDPNAPPETGTLSLFNPDTGQFLAPAQIGTSVTQETAFVQLFVGQSSVSGNGADAPAIDLKLHIQLKAPGAQLAGESLRIVGRDGGDTGFFQVAELEQVALPLVRAP
jgi:hypothetical protein